MHHLVQPGFKACEEVTTAAVDLRPKRTQNTPLCKAKASEPVLATLQYTTAKTARKVSSSAAVCLIKHSVLGFVSTKNVSVKEVLLRVKRKKFNFPEKELFQTFKKSRKTWRMPTKCFICMHFIHFIRLQKFQDIRFYV